MANYKISTEQARQSGNILGIAIVERLDRIVELLETRPQPVDLAAMVVAAVERGTSGADVADNPDHH